MAKEKKFVYRIKDLQTGKYFKKEFWSYDFSRPQYKNLKDKCQYSYSTRYNDEPDRWLYFDTFGHTYPTKMGAECAVSRFNKCSVHKRKTPAGRLLNCRFNLVVVKTEIKYKDVKSETKNDGSSKETKQEVNVQV